MIQLLGRATSGNVQKVIFMLEELGPPYEREDYGKQFDNTTTPEYAAMNPLKKVPTLVDGDTVVWQSNTILRYIREQDGQRALSCRSGATFEGRLLDGLDIADVALGPVVKRCIGFPLALVPLPKTTAWIAALLERPAFEKATATG